MAGTRETGVQYLQVIGRLYPDARLWLQRGYLRDLAPWVDEERTQSELVACLLDENAEVLSCTPMRLQRVCGDSPPQEIRAVRGWIPFHPRTQTVEFRYRERVVHQVRRSEASPLVNLTWCPPGRPSGVQRITWTADHPEGESMEYFLRYSHTGGERWNCISGRITDAETDVDFDTLPGGERCLLAVVATDGINTAMEHTEPFTVEQKPCQAIVLLPVDGSCISAGEPVPLVGQGYWLEEVKPETQDLRWVSSCDGELGHGRVLEVPCLSPGEHEITLIVGSGEREGAATIRIRYGEPASRA